MAVNRYDQFTPMTFKLPETPLEPLAGALQAKQQMYDTSQNLADELSNKYIDALEQDQGRANALTSGWQQKIDDMVENYNGDYSQMYGELRGLRRDITKAFSPQGEAGAIQGNKAAWLKAVEREQAKVDAGKIRQEDFQNWRNYEMSRYTGVGSADPDTGAYNTLNPESIANYVDGEQLARTAAKEIAIRKGGSEAYQDMNGQWITKVGNKWEKLDASEIQRVVQQSLLGNDAYMNYMRQKSRFAGTDFQSDLTGAVTNYMTQMGETYDVDNRWSSVNKSINPVWMEEYKAKKAQSMFGPKGYTRPGQTQGKGFLSNAKIDRYSEAMIGGKPVSVGGIVGGTTRPNSPGANESAEDFWNRTRQTEHFKENPLFTRVYDRQYQRLQNNPDFRAASNEDKKTMLVDAYNAAIDKAGANYETTNPALTLAAQKNLSEQLARGLAFGNVQWVPVDENGNLGEPEQAPDELVQQLEKKGKAPIALADINVVDGMAGPQVIHGDQRYMLAGALTDTQQGALDPLAQMSNA